MRLAYALDQLVDVLLSVAQVTTLNKMTEFASSEATSRVRELKWPQEVGCLLEVGTNYFFAR